MCFFVQNCSKFHFRIPHQWPKGFCLQCITDRSTGLHYFMTTPASWVVPLNTPLNIGWNIVPLGLGKSKLSRDNPTSYLSIYIYIWLVIPLTMTTLRFFKHCNGASPHQPMAPNTPWIAIIFSQSHSISLVEEEADFPEPLLSWNHGWSTNPSPEGPNVSPEGPN